MNGKDTSIQFKRIEISDRDIFARALKTDPAKTENSSFATNYLWAGHFNISYAVIDDCIVLRYIMNGETSYAFPFGSTDENKLLAVKKLSRLCKKEGRPFYLGPVTEEDKDLLDRKLTGLFEFAEERSEFEYVYRKEKLIGLDEFSDLRYKKKLIGQLKSSGNLQYHEISQKSMKLCMQVEDEWLWEKMDSLSSLKAQNSLSDEEYEDERSVLASEHELIKKAFNHFDELKLFGGVLTLDEKPIAFTIAEEQSPDTVLVHIEKALKGIKGAYQAINNFFAEQSCEKYSFINREEDTGDANLRQAKMSYRPDKLVKIYSAEEIRPVFRFLDEAEFKNTKSICKEIFKGEENEEFFDDFFKEKIKKTRIAVLELNGKIAALTQVWNIKCSSPKGDEHVPYFYATATLPNFRLLGLRDLLFQNIFSVLKEEGANWVFLSPENKNIWKSLGFDISFEMSENEKAVLETDDDIEICLVHEIKEASFIRPTKMEFTAW